MKKILQAILALSLLLAAFSQEQNLDRQEHWNKVGLSYSQLLEQSRHCERSPQYQLACKSAAETLLKHAGIHPRKLNSKDYASSLRAIPDLYFEGKVPAAAVASAWISFLQIFDAHASIFPASWEEAQASRSEDSFAGIGIHLRSYEGRYRISAIVPESPAQKSGMRLGDLITKIDNKDTAAIARENLAKLLNGPGGTSLRIEILRDGKVQNLRLKRRNIRIPILMSKILLQNETGKQLGYLSLRTMNKKGICEEASSAIRALEKNNLSALVLDLRGNPGGYVNEARCISSLFLGNGKLWASFRKIENPLDFIPHKQRIPEKEEKADFVLYTEGNQITKLPLIIVIDSGTASAAEMVAASLRDHQRALISGEQSFGKGMMQSMYSPWEREDIVLAKSTHEIFRPNGASIQKIGISPDFPLPTL